MHQGNDLNIEWQNSSKYVLELVEKFVAHMYYRANFAVCKPKIRVMMATWFFCKR